MQTLYVDCRPRDAYLAGHVPGAAHADPEADLTGDVGGGRHPLPSAAQFAAWASSAGIGGDTHVVAYDEGTGWAARLWWLLRHYGHDSAEAIRLEDWEGELVAGEERIEPAVFEPRERSGDTADAQEVLRRLGDSGLTLVDARAPERWRGETEPIDPVAGRIPGAKNRFNLDNLSAQGTFKSPDELKKDFQSVLQGRAPADVIHYCGSGVAACHNLLAMEVAGLKGGKLYAGSWSEWARDPKRPQERG
jgi:thiosulfate/3-mercaptopyruvate sulfurtransferase